MTLTLVLVLLVLFIAGMILFYTFDIVKDSDTERDEILDDWYNTPTSRRVPQV